MSLISVRFGAAVIKTRRNQFCPLRSRSQKILFFASWKDDVGTVRLVADGIAYLVHQLENAMQGEYF